MKILHFSPVRKPFDIVKLHLESLQHLRVKNIELTLSFFDDNINDKSSQYLRQFVEETNNTFLHKLDLTHLDNYTGDLRWTYVLYERITFIKDKVITYFLENDFDYLFLTDSDLIVHPNTLENLVNQKKDFCTAIFWTQFDKSIPYSPNAWYAKSKGFTKLDLINLSKKGTFPVDFTGACTLLSRKILEDKVSFKKIPNIEYLGEDKHFCIRAAVMGYQPFCATHFPAFHIYNESYIDQAKEILNSNFKNNYADKWLDIDWEIKIESWLKPKKKSLIRKMYNKFK